MQHHLFWLVFVAYFSFFNKCETTQPQAENGASYILSQLLDNKNKPPIILYLEPGQNDRLIEDNARSMEQNPEDVRQYARSIEENQEELGYMDNYDREDDSDENFLRTRQSDERAYVLYHLLRTTIEEENIDPDTVQNLQPAKEFLRKAFVGRCRRLNKCLRQCPKPKTKYICTVQCKQIFDDLDECDKPKEDKCGISKCGNTMPPAWLL